MTLLLRRAYVGSVTSETHFSVHIHFSMLTENCSRVTLKCLETTTESMYWVSPNKIVFENIWPQMIIVPFLCLLRYEIPSSIFVEVLLAILSYKLQCYGSTGVSMNWFEHYDDVIMSAIASQITSLTIVYSTVYSGADQRKHQSSASQAFVWGIHRDRWIPRTKGQLRGKCFHLMTSSWKLFRRSDMVTYCQSCIFGAIVTDKGMLITILVKMCKHHYWSMPTLQNLPDRTSCYRQFQWTKTFGILSFNIIAQLA